MLRILSMAAFCLSLALGQLSAAAADKQTYFLAEYQGVGADDVPRLDQFFRDALLPALGRMSVQNVGVFSTDAAENGTLSMYLLVPLSSPEQLVELRQRLMQDEQFASAGENYLASDVKNPPFSRIRSELLVAFDCHPQVEVPPQKKAGKDRLFELRTYESATELKGALKVEMFNSGEVPIFLDSDIQPVFMGEAIVGDRMPSLTYMTVYDDAASRDEAWKKFVAHPDWQVLKGEPRYADTVSKIYKTDLHPREYSQL